MNQDREFWIRVQGGLCNRMRTLASAIGYAEASGRRLRVCWPTTPWLQTAFRGLRSFPWIRRFPSTARFEAGMEHLWANRFETVSVEAWEQVTRQNQPLDFPPPTPSRSDTGLLVLETCHDFFSILPQSPKELYGRLQLLPNLQQRVSRFERSFQEGRHRIGVHLRCVAPHEKTTEFARPEWFLDRVSAALKTWPDAQLFLVTDSQPAGEAIRRLCSHRIVEQPPAPGFNTRKAIQKALVDVHLLSRTDYIIGSYFSSMSYLSADMQGRNGYEDTHHRWGYCPPPRKV